LQTVAQKMANNFSEYFLANPVDNQFDFVLWGQRSLGPKQSGTEANQAGGEPARGRNGKRTKEPLFLPLACCLSTTCANLLLSGVRVLRG